jgi:hypothetical protein
MSTVQMAEWTRKRWRFPRTRFVGVYYLLTALASAFVLFFHGKRALAVDLDATIFYIAATALFYGLSRPVKRKR